MQHCTGGSFRNSGTLALVDALVDHILSLITRDDSSAYMGDICRKRVRFRYRTVAALDCTDEQGCARPITRRCGKESYSRDLSIALLSRIIL